MARYRQAGIHIFFSRLHDNTLYAYLHTYTFETMCAGSLINTSIQYRTYSMYGISYLFLGGILIFSHPDLYDFARITHSPRDESREGPRRGAMTFS